MRREIAAIAVGSLLSVALVLFATQTIQPATTDFQGRISLPEKSQPTTGALVAARSVTESPLSAAFVLAVALASGLAMLVSARRKL